MWAELNWDSARKLGRKILLQFLRDEDPVDAIYLVYNEFKSAMTQRVVAERLLPVAAVESEDESNPEHNVEFIFEPNEDA